MNSPRTLLTCIGLAALLAPLGRAATPPAIRDQARKLLLERLEDAHQRSMRIFLDRALSRYVGVGWQQVNQAGDAVDPVDALAQVAQSQGFTPVPFWISGLREARKAADYYNSRWERWRGEVAGQLLGAAADQKDFFSPEEMARTAMEILPADSWPSAEAVPPSEKFLLPPGRPPAPILRSSPPSAATRPPVYGEDPFEGLSPLGDGDLPSPGRRPAPTPGGIAYSGESAPPPPGEELPGTPNPADPGAPAGEPIDSVKPSSTYTVLGGQGMGHVAGALARELAEAHPGQKFPDIWVPQEGGRIGLPHVIACYNDRRPEDWRLRVDQLVEFPPHDQIWPWTEYIRENQECPGTLLAASLEPSAALTRSMAPPVEEEGPPPSFEPGSFFRVRTGQTYSHFAIGVHRELRSQMRSDRIPPLYPPPGRHGLMNVLACWNSGDAQDFTLRQGQELQVPPDRFMEVKEFLDRSDGSCPEEFRRQD